MELDSSEDMGHYLPNFSHPDKKYGIRVGLQPGRGVQFFTPVMIALIATQYSFGAGIFLAAIFAILTGLWVWTLPETRGRAIKKWIVKQHNGKNHGN